MNASLPAPLDVKLMNLTASVLFAGLVLITAAAGKANATTATGAAIFFWARLVYAVIYLIGVPWLRTLVWFVSVIGMAMIAWVLLQAS